MNRKVFMERLRECLADISAEEREDALTYYESYFEEAGVENAQVCAGTENGNKETSPEQAEKTVPESRNTGDNLMPRIRAFHDEIFEYYRETMSGDRNLLFRMKDLWSYMLAEVPDSEKLAKKIRKSQHVPEYLAAVDEAFAGWERTF